MNELNLNDLKDEIATALDWNRNDVNAFSLQSLRELVRPLLPRLVTQIDEAIARGSHIKNLSKRGR